jgi:hypothetical protein
MVNEKVLGATSLCLVLLMVIGAWLISSLVNSPVVQEELDFTVSGSNECLRFLTRDVNVAYVPFTTGPNEQWRLVVECTEIGLPNGWVDLYLYEDYWDEGFDNKCYSEDTYSILDSVESLDFELGLDSPYSQVFGEIESASYTLFFIFPPGGPSSFHVTLSRLA